MGDAAIERLAGIEERMTADDPADLDVEFTFAYNGACAILEAIRLSAAARDVRLRVSGSGPEAGEYARRVGFGGAGVTTSTTIPLHRFTGPSAGGSVGNYLTYEWAALARSLSGVTIDYVVSSIGEVFENALTHGRSPTGVVSCGQFYPKKNLLALSVVDLGVGIPGSLAASTGRREERIGDAGRAIAWAFEPGHSSRATSRGLGLAIIRAFVIRSSGSLRVYSGRGYYELRATETTVRTLPFRFPGTLVDIDLPVDRVSVPAVGESLY